VVSLEKFSLAVLLSIEVPEAGASEVHVGRLPREVTVEFLGLQSDEDVEFKAEDRRLGGTTPGGQCGALDRHFIGGV